MEFEFLVPRVWPSPPQQSKEGRLVQDGGSLLPAGQAGHRAPKRRAAAGWSAVAGGHHCLVLICRGAAALHQLLHSLGQGIALCLPSGRARFTRASACWAHSITTLTPVQNTTRGHITAIQSPVVAAPPRCVLVQTRPSATSTPARRRRAQSLSARRALPHCPLPAPCASSGPAAQRSPATITWPRTWAGVWGRAARGGRRGEAGGGRGPLEGTGARSRAHRAEAERGPNGPKPPRLTGPKGPK